MTIEKIISYKLEIYRKPTRWSFTEDKFEVKEKSVLAQNDKYLVLNDDYFTKLEKKGDGVVWSRIDTPSISFRDCLSQDGIFFTLYSTKPRRISTIKGMIKRKADEKYGWLFSESLDLSIMDKAA